MSQPKPHTKTLFITRLESYILMETPTTLPSYKNYLNSATNCTTIQRNERARHIGAYPNWTHIRCLPVAIAPPVSYDKPHPNHLLLISCWQAEAACCNVCFWHSHMLHTWMHPRSSSCGPCSNECTAPDALRTLHSRRFTSHRPLICQPWNAAMLC